MSFDHSPNAGPPPGGDGAEDVSPPTETKGELVPPPRKPPTAVSGPVSDPDPRPPRPSRPWRSPAPRETVPRAVAQAIDAALDVLDSIGDSVREAASRLAG